MDRVLENIQEGRLVTSKWLREQGVSRPYKDFLLREGRLLSVAHGVYRKPGPPLKWQAIVYSLQLMGYDLWVGGLSSLELQGVGHYLNVSGKADVRLYGNDKMPKWVSEVCPSARFFHHRDALFKGSKDLKAVEESLKRGANKDDVTQMTGIHSIPWGNWDWSIALSTRERAILETMDDLPNGMSFEDVDMLMQGMVNLSPSRVQRLLEDCQNIKVKRLFLWFAERHNHAWYKKLKADQISLGSGKRMLTKGGKLNHKYQITVPREFSEPENY